MKPATSLFVVALAGAACTASPKVEPGKGDGEPRPEVATAKSEPAKAPVAPAPETVKAEPTKAPVAPAGGGTQALAPVAPAAPEAGVTPGPAPVAPAAPVVAPEPVPSRGTLAKAEPGVATWEERPDLAGITDFHPIPLGVLALCDEAAGRWCELGRDGKLVTSKHVPGDEDLVGSWPSDAWQVRREDDESAMEDPSEEYETWTTVTFDRWDGRRFARKGRFKIDLDPHDAMDGTPSVGTRKGWAGGMLLLDYSTVRHVPGSAKPTTLPGDVWDLFEAESGRLLLVTHRGNRRLTVDPHCPKAPCVEPGFELQDETTSTEPWTFPLDVARGGSSLTIVAEHPEEGTYLLHYDAPGPKGSFRLETLPMAVSTSMMWPDGHGGVWLQAETTLWYRDASGRWLEVTPPGRTVLACASRTEPRELLVLVEDEKGENHVHATKAPATPAAAGTAPTGTAPVAPASPPVAK